MSDAVNPFANVKIATAPKSETKPDIRAENKAPLTEKHLVKEELAAPIVATKAKRSPSHKVEPKVMEKIKEASIQQGYRSDSKAKRETTKTHAYTFYPSDIKAVRRIKMAVMEDDLDINVSDSEVMRAAIAALASLSFNEQKNLIQEQKER